MFKKMLVMGTVVIMSMSLSLISGYAGTANKGESIDIEVEDDYEPETEAPEEPETEPEEPETEPETEPAEPETEPETQPEKETEETPEAPETEPSKEPERSHNNGGGGGSHGGPNVNDKSYIPEGPGHVVETEPVVVMDVVEPEPTVEVIEPAPIVSTPAPEPVPVKKASTPLPKTGDTFDTTVKAVGIALIGLTGFFGISANINKYNK